MPIFLAFALVQLALFVFIAGDTQSWSRGSVRFALHNPALGVALALLPACAFYLTLDTLHRLRPRRLLDTRRTRDQGEAVALAGLGIGAGLVHALASGVGLGLLARTGSSIPEWLVFPCSAVLAGACCWVMLRRVKPGVCVQCGYDARGLGRCPECGRWEENPASATSPAAGVENLPSTAGLGIVREPGEKLSRRVA